MIRKLALMAVLPVLMFATIGTDWAAMAEERSSICYANIMGDLDRPTVATCEAFVMGDAGMPRERAMAYVNLGHAYRTRPGQFRNPVLSLEAWDKAIAEDQGYAEPHVLKGEVAARSQNLEEALKHYDAALALEPDHWRALMGKARVFMQRGQSDEALALGKAAMDSASSVGVAHQIYGSLLEAAGRVDDALDHYRIATVGFDRNTRRLPGIMQEAPPWNAIADAELRLGNTTFAIEAISHMIDGLDDGEISPPSLIFRAQLYEAAGRAGDAAKDYERAVNLYGPGFVGADEYRAKAAMLRASAGDATAARDTFRDLIRSGKLKSILRIQVFLKNNGYDIDIDGTVSPSLERALEQCLSDSDCSATMGQAI